MGTYYGRKVTTGENHAEVGVDLNDPTKFFEPKLWPQTLAAGGVGGTSDEALLEHLQEYGAKIENEHGPAIAADNNITSVLNEVVQSRLQDAGDVRDFYRHGCSATSRRRYPTGLSPIWRPRVPRASLRN